MKRFVLLSTAITGILALLLCSVWAAPRPLNLQLSMTDQQILLALRLPRTILAFLAGGTLAIGGCVFQALFRNPLASPYTLGVSSGSAFGASIAIVFGISLISPTYSLMLAALAGGFLTSLLVLWIGHQSRQSTETLILAGVVLTFLFGSIGLFLQYLSDYARVFALSRWMMGSVGVIGWDELASITPIIFLFMFWIYRNAKALDLLLYGHEFSFARGVNPGYYVPRFVFAVSIPIALIVAVCGPIGFVGILVPHAVRLLGYRQHTRLLPLSFVLGGVFLVLSDASARTIAYPYELPVGILTALLGSPLFLLLLLKKQV